MATIILPIRPLSYVRMTKQSRFKKRALEYYAWRDNIRLLLKLKKFNFDKCSSLRIVFYFPLPKSFSKAKKTKLLNTPHRQKIDLDNAIKALIDAIFYGPETPDDAHLWRIEAEKRWAIRGRIEVSALELDAHNSPGEEFYDLNNAAL